MPASASSAIMSRQLCTRSSAVKPGSRRAVRSDSSMSEGELRGVPGVAAERVGPPESGSNPRRHGNLPSAAVVAHGGEVVVAQVADGAAWKDARTPLALADVVKLDAGNQLRVKARAAGTLAANTCHDDSWRPGQKNKVARVFRPVQPAHSMTIHVPHGETRSTPFSFAAISKWRVKTSTQAARPTSLLEGVLHKPENATDCGQLVVLKAGLLLESLGRVHLMPNVAM